MQLHQHETETQESSNVAKEYLTGLVETARNWKNLDDKTKKEALTYYGYTLSVAIGAPAAGIAAFLART
ncbi:MAG: hypothetical protein QG639_1131 [Patescibacteria group bacterium]|jgi:hypothetical protein|nr:hypothetical protein [Patescibacteria group bacterium]